MDEKKLEKMIKKNLSGRTDKTVLTANRKEEKTVFSSAAGTLSRNGKAERLNRKLYRVIKIGQG